jgi:hypothetical protein
VAIEGGSLHACRHGPSVVLDGGPGKVRPAPAGGWLVWIVGHGSQVGPRA